MGACREGYRLYGKAWKFGWHHIFKNIKSRGVKKFNWKLAFEDNFMFLVCLMFGHQSYVPDEYDPDEIACKRCHRWL